MPSPACDGGKTALRGREELRIAALQDEPAATGDPRADAYLGALVEHLAATHGVPRPARSVESSGSLETFWLPSEVPGFRATAIAQSPAAFRGRWDLHRARCAGAGLR